MRRVKGNCVKGGGVKWGAKMRGVILASVQRVNIGGVVCGVVMCGSAAGAGGGQEILVSSAAEITAALSTAGPGDTLVMTDGTWTDQAIVFAGMGTQAKPITLRAQTPGRVVLTGASRLNISGQWLVVEGLQFKDGALPPGNALIDFNGPLGVAKNSVLAETAVIDYNPASTATRYHWVEVKGQDNELRNNFFKGQNHSGVTVAVSPSGGLPSRARLVNNHFVDRPVGTGNGFETIRLGTSDVQTISTQTVVEKNLFERTDGEIETISNKTSNNVFRQNTFRNVEGTLTMRHGRGALVEGNFFLGENNSQSGGVRVIGPDHVIVNNYFSDLGTRADGAISVEAGEPNFPPTGYEPVSNVQIVHNTIRNANMALIRMDTGFSSSSRNVRPTNVTVANNILNSTQKTLIQGTEGSGWTWAGNVAFGATLGVTSRPGILVANPLLVLDTTPGGGGLYRPGVTSPALNAAVSGVWTAPQLDMDGQNRGTPADIGADEVIVNGNVVSKPLNGADVGPGWLNRRMGASASYAVPVVEMKAEKANVILDPNADGQTWKRVYSAAAMGGSYLKAPAGAIVNLSNGPQDAVVEYDFAVHDAGTYRLYGLVRGFDTSSDSVFVPATIGASPTVSKTIGSNGLWQWIELGQYTIAAAEVNRPLRLQIGRRERNVEIDTLVLSPQAMTLAVPVGASSWALSTGGSANTSGNWTGGVPNATGAGAVFGGTIGQAAAVNVSGTLRMGRMEFNSLQSYTLSGGEVRLDETIGDALVVVNEGSHVMSSSVVLDDDVLIHAEKASSALDMTGLISGVGKQLTKSGDGRLNLPSLATIGGMEILAGTVGLTKAGAGNADEVMVLDEVLINDLGVGGGVFDLNTSSLFIRSEVAADTAGLLADVTAMAGGGRITFDQDLNGVGLMMVIGLSADMGLSEIGQTVLPGEGVLVRVTFGGDANLDGAVNSFDYSVVDDSFGQNNGGVLAGDLNGDGVTDSFDYSLIDDAFGARFTPPLAPPLAPPLPPPLLRTVAYGMGQSAAVPEPGAGVVLMAMGGLMGRRRAAHGRDARATKSESFHLSTIS